MTLSFWGEGEAEAIRFGESPLLPLHSKTTMLFRVRHLADEESPAIMLLISDNNFKSYPENNYCMLYQPVI
jgi:hypothetical protein